VGGEDETPLRSVRSEQETLDLAPVRQIDETLSRLQAIVRRWEDAIRHAGDTHSDEYAEGYVAAMTDAICDLTAEFGLVFTGNAAMRYKWKEL